MRSAMPQPCIGSSASVFKISRSSVPCSRSVGLPIRSSCRSSTRRYAPSCRTSRGKTFDLGGREQQYSVVSAALARLPAEGGRAPTPSAARPVRHGRRLPQLIGEFRFWKSAHSFWKPRRALARKLGETHRLLRITSWPCGCSVQGITQGENLRSAAPGWWRLPVKEPDVMVKPLRTCAWLLPVLMAISSAAQTCTPNAPGGPVVPATPVVVILPELVAGSLGFVTKISIVNLTGSANTVTVNNISSAGLLLTSNSCTIPANGVVRIDTPENQ